MDFYFNLQVDCEATHPAVANPALGERAILGLAELLAREGLKATFVVVPSDMEVHAAQYRQLELAGHEVGVHCHPATQGYQEFLGVYSYNDQVRILQECIDVFAQGMGHLPLAFTPGYCSTNDHTFLVSKSLGFRHGHVSCPRAICRNAPACGATLARRPLSAPP